MTYFAKFARLTLIGCLSLSSVVTVADLQDGLVGYWKLDEGKGKETQDSWEKGHIGTFVAGDAKWVDGKYGKALQFDGASDVEIPDHEDFHLTDAISVALWAKPEGAQASWAKFFIKQKSGEYPYSLQYDDGQEIFATVHAAARFDTAPHLPTFEEWAHLAFTYDGEAIILYKDGEEVARQAANGELQQNDLSLSIGGRLNSNQDFKGAIDEVYLYNRPLEPNEINQLMEGIDVQSVDPMGKVAITWGTLKMKSR